MINKRTRNEHLAVEDDGTEKETRVFGIKKIPPFFIQTSKSKHCYKVNAAKKTSVSHSSLDDVCS